MRRSAAEPVVDGATFLERFAEVNEVLRSKDFVQHQPEREEFIGRSLLMIDGTEHFQRRRMEAALFTKAAVVSYERTALVPTIAEMLTNARAAAEDVYDLVPLVRDMLHRISASVVGLDGVESPAEVSRFRELVERLHLASTIEVSLVDREEILQPARRARAELVERYVAPSLNRRRALFVTGELRSSSDLLSLLVAHHLDDADFVLGEVILYVIASVSTTTHALPHAFGHICEWFDQDPERRALAGDRQFLRGAVAESLRMHTANPYLIRRASGASRLTSGRDVAAGEVLVLDVAMANRDPEVFGLDAEEYDPTRSAQRGIREWGLTFGGGEHLCIGRPLVTGVKNRQRPDEESDGTMVAMLEALFREDIRPAPDRPPVRHLASEHDAYSSFPVRFGRSASQR